MRIAVIEPLETYLCIPNGTQSLSSGNSNSSNVDADLPLEDDGHAHPFVDLYKRRFLWYFESYLNSIDVEEKKVTRNQSFAMMPFESPMNGMNGQFDYAELRRRLNKIKDAIFDETKHWADEGQEASSRETSIAANLRRQFEQVVESFKYKKNFTADLTLVDENPFLWELTCFGRPMTHLDGGIFKIRICLSPRFPDEQPRVFMQTPLFHHRVSKNGVLCYFPKKTDDMGEHVDAIVAIIEEDSPAYDPRATVNPEASKLLWSPDGRRQYNRALRRSVERSVE